MLKESHKILLKSVKCEHKLPDEFRKSQNWIGGATINDAKFIPPVHTFVNDLISDIEHFTHNNKNKFPELLKIALIHYQFETIHPFLDGNGRIGRLIITLYLINIGLLKMPVLYLSDFFERNKEHYYNNLTGVRKNKDITQWFKFFLVGIIETAKSSISTFDNILKLRQDVEITIQTLAGRASNAQKIINIL